MLKLIEFYKTKHDYKSQFHDEENGDWRLENTISVSAREFASGNYTS